MTTTPSPKANTPRFNSVSDYVNDEEGNLSADFSGRRFRFWRIFKQAEADALPGLKELEWEALAWQLVTPWPPFPTDGNAARFVETFFEVKLLTEDAAAIAHLESRLSVSRNPVLRARYGDVLWDALRVQKRRDAHTAANIALHEYLRVAELAAKQALGNDFVVALLRAVDIGVRLNNAKAVESAVTKGFALLRKLDEKQRRRWLLEFGRAIVAIRQTKVEGAAPDSTVRQVIRRARLAAEGLRAEKDFLLERPFLELVAEAERSVGRSAATIRARREIVASSITEADYKLRLPHPRGGSLVAAHFLQAALTELVRLQSSDIGKRLRTQLHQQSLYVRHRIQTLLKAGREEVKPIAFEMKLPIKQVEPFVEKLLEKDAAHALLLLAHAHHLLPDRKQAETSAKQAARKYPLQALMPTSTIRRGTVTAGFGSDELEGQVLKHLSLQATMLLGLLGHLINRLEVAGFWSTESLLAHFRSWEIGREADIQLIQVGVERYFAKDYVSALHVLIPRIESMLKGIFETIGVPTLAAHSTQGRLLEVGFGEFIRRPEVRRSLGERIYTLVEYTLVNPAGMNLRNDVAHGWIEHAGCRRELVDLVIFQMLLLTAFKVTPRKKKVPTRRRPPQQK